MIRQYIFRAIDIILIASVASQILLVLPVSMVGPDAPWVALIGLFLIFSIGIAGEALDRAGYFSRGKHHDER